MDELGIHSVQSRPPFTEMIDGVLKAEEQYMIQLHVEGRTKRRRAVFDAKTLRLRLS